jgi:tRNA (cmo5U34)-methyltransferase
MSRIWDPHTYDAARKRLVPCFDSFYGTAVDLVAHTLGLNPRVLDLGAGTGLLSELLAARVQPSVLCVVDASQEMLTRAEQRLARWNPLALIQDLTAPLPPGPFDAVVSALAVHHLSDVDKKDLIARILAVLVPGGVFVNAEQVQGASQWQQQLFETMHLSKSRALGSSEEEIAGAIERMSHDRCAPLSRQLEWLRDLGYVRVDCFFQWFRFAVYAGWKPM